jgi:hypothetical protein
VRRLIAEFVRVRRLLSVDEQENRAWASEELFRSILYVFVKKKSI